MIKAKSEGTLNRLYRKQRKGSKKVGRVINMTNEQMFEQILNELKGLNNRVGNIENRLGGVEVELQGVKGEVQIVKGELQDVKSKMNSRFDTLEAKIALVQEDVTEIKVSTGRMEENEPANIYTMLKQINRKLDDRDNDIQALNKRVFKTESEIERLTSQ